MSKGKLTAIIIILSIIIIILSIAVLIWVIMAKGGNQEKLITPGGNQTVQPTTSSYNPPKEIKFDSSTDLKEELEKINPEVVEEDFAGAI